MALEYVEVRRIADAVYDSSIRPSPLLLTLQALAREKAILQQLRGEHCGGGPWMIEPEPAHRWDEKTPDASMEIERETREAPLLYRWIEYGGMKWLLYRPIWTLTAEEMPEGSVYRKRYDKMLAERRIPPGKEIRFPELITTAP